MTPEEQLEYERHIAAILQIRKPPDKPTSNLSTWLNSNFLTAIITVLGTAVIGVVVSGVIQDRSKHNDREQSAIDARRQSQRVAVDKLLSLAGTFLSTSDDLLTTVNDAYGIAGRTPAQVTEQNKWKTGILEARDKADLDWRRSKRSLGFELRDVFDGNVDKEWTAVASATESFEKCTRDWYVASSKKLTSLKANQICSAERSNVEAATDDLIRTARTLQRKSLEAAAGLR
jgi:hypothetical protein